MGVLIDTGVLIDAQRGRTHLDALPVTEAAVSVITLAELWHGAARADTEARRQLREAFVEDVRSWAAILRFDEDAALRYGRLWAATNAAGTPLQPHDLMIAATAQVIGWEVWTDNVRDFDKVPGIRLFEP